MEIFKNIRNQRRAGKIYRSLRSRDREIRVVILQGGPPGSPIRCKLRHVSLNDPDLNYVALSYTWGDLIATEKILLDEEKHHVTANLFTALEHFRKPHQDVCLWIDAICVNQYDLEERGEQVRLMRDVFSHAKATIVWLGPEADDSDLAIDLVDLLSDVLMDCVEKYKVYSKFDALTWGTRESWGIEKEIHALVVLLQRPWFYRVWVVQEAAMGKDLTVVCGKQSTTWLKLYHVYHFFMTMSMHFPTFDGWEGLHRIIFINEILDAHGQWWASDREHQMDLLVLLGKHRQARATDPRDKCIALMGLASGNFQKDSANFYSQSVQHMYCSTMVDIANQTQHKPLTFLSYSGHPRIRDDLPSWVPDWSYTEFTGHVFPWWHIENAIEPETPVTFFNILPGLSLEKAHIFNFSDDKTTLFASGIIIDSIDMATLVNQRASGTRIADRADGMDAKMWQPLKEHTKYPTAEPVEDILWRTMVFDRNNFGGPVTAERWKWVFYWLFKEAAVYYENFEQTGELDKTPFQESYLDWWYLYSTVKFAGTTIGDVVRKGGPTDFANAEVPAESEIHLLTSAVAAATGGRRVIVSEQGYLGIVPGYSAADDLITILYGCPVPVILRNHGTWYECIGTCYVHGIMEGETVPKIQSGEYPTVKFEIR